MKIVTAKELGQYLKLSESTIYKLAGNGEIPAFRLGDSWRFDMEEIIQTIRNAKNRPDLDLKQGIAAKA
ncbi:MAG: helix-turn-helix domain-containing protein [Thermodesulfobacteriota bacterium]